MAFCGSCGAQLDGNQRFCGKCGADQGATPAVAPSVPVAGAAGAPTPQPYAAAASIPPPIAAAGIPPQLPPYPGTPYSQGAPGPIPVMMGPPAAASKRHPALRAVMWTLIVVAAVLYGLYYIGTHDQQSQTPPQTQPPAQGQPVQGQPGQPGVQGQQPGAPGPQGQAPQTQPGAPGQPANNASLVQMQTFTGQVGEANGQVQITNGLWTNHSTVAIQSATLECIQYGANSQALTQNQTTVTGPVQSQSSMSFNPFSVGTVVQGATRAQCGIVAVTPAG